MNDAYDVGVLILRLVLGLTLAAHGFNKFFGGGRIPGTAGWFESIGMKYGTFQAVVAATTEISAGLGLAAGLLTPIPAAGFVALMLVAAWTVHRHNGFFIVKEGWESNLILAVGDILGIGSLGVAATSSKDEVLAIEADCVVYSPLIPNDDEVIAILRSGKNIVTPVGWVYPDPGNPRHQAVADAAAAAGVTLH